MLRVLAVVVCSLAIAACGTRYDTYGDAERAGVVDKVGVAQIIAPLRGNTIEVYSADGLSKEFKYYYFFKNSDRMAVVSSFERTIYNIRTTNERLCWSESDVHAMAEEDCYLMAVKKPTGDQTVGNFRHFALFKPSGEFWEWSSRGLRPGVDFSHDASASLLGGYNQPGPQDLNAFFADRVWDLDR